MNKILFLVILIFLLLSTSVFSKSKIDYNYYINLTDESLLENHALVTSDSIIKEIIFWRLNNLEFIKELISEESDYICKEILQSRYDMLTIENYSWFWELCERHIYLPDFSLAELSDEEIKVRNFLNFFYSDYFKFRKYICLQDSIEYTFDDRINELNSSLLFDQIENKSNKCILVEKLLLEIENSSLIYYSAAFNHILKSIFNYSTLPNFESDKLLNSISTKIKLVFNPDPFARKEFDIKVYPQIKLIFNEDMTRVKIDARISKDREYRFYNFENGRWEKSNKKEGVYIDCD